MIPIKLGIITIVAINFSDLNAIKHKIQNIFGNWLDMLSIKKQLTDDQIECMQFGICNYSLEKVGEVPFFHY